MRCGQTPSVQETHVFLQTWLYFGTLHEIFGDSVDLSDFIVTDEHDDRFLYTANLKAALNNLIDQSVDAGAAEDVQLQAITKLCKRMYSHLDNLYRILGGLMEVADLATLAATAILGEALENFVSRIYSAVLKLETPPEILWGSFSGWIINHLKSTGWCPSNIARLAAHRPSISLLYYYYQLPVPQGTRDHSTCTEGTCLALKIDPSVYRTAHTEISCGCPELTLGVEEIGRILGDDRLPLIEVSQENPATAEIRPREDDGQVGFVAISHVWADGLGNVKNNSLPACSLQEISRMVDQLPRSSSQPSGCVPFWIDTVCVPVEPAAMKRVALNKLRHPYMRAAHVLVLDNYLRTVNAGDCDVLEIAARLSCCNWVSRLWTLQEGRLAKRVWFQFKDKAIELKALWEEMGPTQLPRYKGLHYWSLLVTVISRWIATDLSGGTKNNLGFLAIPSHILVFIRHALCFRSVSVPADEALCLFCLADLEMEKITSVQASASLRMKKFWGHMQTVPSGLLFSQCLQKLDEPGFRWAPLSFMGALPRNHWAGSPGVEDDSKGRPTSRGLLASFPGFICNIVWKDMDDYGGFFFRGAGDWLRVYLDEPWHPTSPFVPPEGPQKMAVILMKPLQGHTSRDPHHVEESKWPDWSAGVLGTLSDDDDHAGVKNVKCLRHVTVHPMKPVEQFINDIALEYVLAEVLDRDSSLDVEERAVRMANACFEEHPSLASACQKWIIGSSYATGKDRFVARIIEMAKPTKDYGGIAEELTEKQEWCID